MNKIFEFVDCGYGSDLYLVKISGDIIFSQHKLVTSNIQFIRKLDDVDVTQMAKIIETKKGSKKRYIGQLIANNPWIDKYNYIEFERRRSFIMSIDDTVLPDDLKKSWEYSPL